ncbi:MAG: Gfo/Idh/MocA family oxidoreductase [Planctomycetales bacterium]|nr:Gfo/Idh/MocA family oxidoreductase [Planctomycetales bacterium]
MSEPLDRRRFLEKSAAVGSAFSLLTSTSRSAERVSANDTLVVAVVGVNGRGRAHAEGFAQQPGVEVAYICDVDERIIPRAIEQTAKYQERKPQGVRDFRELLDDKSVDIISIATPNHWHAPAAIMACAAGKHVYVEKPCSYTAEEGELTIQAARKYDRVVQMGNQRRSRAPMIEAIGKIRDGVLGNVLVSRTWYNSRRGSIGVGKEVAVPPGLDFDLWQGPAPARPYKDNLVHYNWHWHWHWGNGELGNNGVHAIDVARWGMGVDYPSYVTSTGGRIRFDDDQETPDTHFVAFHFGEKMITWEGLSWSPFGPEGSQFGISFHGDEGSMVLDDTGYRILDMHNKVVENVAGTGSDAEHYADFLEAIRTGRRPSSDIEEGHQSTLLCHLGNISQRTGRPLQTDPENGHILEDAEAQKLWAREEYREGFDPKAFV